MKRIAVVSLGCDKNRVDTEHALALLKSKGWEPVDTPETADAVLINTCAFIDAAKKESIDTVLEFAALKEKNPDLKLAVTGCLAERYAENLRESIPEIDILTGIRGYKELPELLDAGEGESFPEKEIPCGEGRTLTTPPHYAYLKIADGCDNFCTYCAIPSIRGRYRSYPMEELVAEAQSLFDEGVRELIVVAQDTTRYGDDLYGRYALAELLEKICKAGFRWVRILYAYPELITEELLRFMKNTPQIVPYLDVPLQHYCDGVWKRMNRRSKKRDVEKLFSMIEKIYPELTVRSTFITGFPGETDEEFSELENFISSGRVKYAGFFPYSREEGTRAYQMTGQIPMKLKKERAKRLSVLQAETVKKFHDRWVGKTVPVVYEGIDYRRGKFYGRTPFQTPEIDPVIYFTAPFPVEIGEIYTVKIEKGGFYMTGVAESGFIS